MLQRNSIIKTQNIPVNHSPTTSTYFTFRKPGDLLTMTVGEETYFYVQNIRGDVVALMDSSGSQIASYSYDTWGVPVISNPSNLPNPFLYQGSYATFYDDELGMYGMGARHYNPKTMRFISRDLNHGTLTNTMSQNLYIYCYNNPLGFKDPSGFSPVSVSCGMAGGLTGDTGMPYKDEDMGYNPYGVSEDSAPSKADEKLRATYDTWLEVTGSKDNAESWAKFYKLWTAAKVVAVNMQKYKEGSNGEDYNRYDQEIAFWTVYWNQKACLGLDGKGLVGLANLIKGICYVETRVGYSAHTGNGIMQVDTRYDLTYGEFPNGKEGYLSPNGYISPKFYEKYKEEGSLWNNVNAGIFCGIARFMKDLSAFQPGRNGTPQNLTNFTNQKNKVLDRDAYMKTLIRYGPGARKPSTADPNYQSYNTNHENVASLRYDGYGFESAYGMAIMNLVETGRDPYSYKDEGATGDTSKNYLFIP